jgi:hypothetical protein
MRRAVNFLKADGRSYEIERPTVLEHHVSVAEPGGDPADIEHFTERRDDRLKFVTATGCAQPSNVIVTEVRLGPQQAGYSVQHLLCRDHAHGLTCSSTGLVCRLEGVFLGASVADTPESGTLLSEAIDGRSATRETVDVAALWDRPSPAGGTARCPCRSWGKHRPRGTLPAARGRTLVRIGGRLAATMIGLRAAQ